MSINYLYIDDEETKDVSYLIEQIEHKSEGKINIEHIQVMNMSDIISKFNSGSFDGFIIDQELTKKSIDNIKVDYHGTTLAQHLRTEMALEEVPQSPLILLSNNSVIVASFKPDDTSSNLFDYVIKKDDLPDDILAIRMVNTLIDVVEGYDKVRQYQTGSDLSESAICDILECNLSNYKYLDTRFIDHLKSKSALPHALVNSIYSSLVCSAGMLVTEKMLATKFGIDLTESDDWGSFKDMFNCERYKGIFCNIKNRWWMAGINKWWFNNSINGEPLQALSCEERVDEIKEITGLQNLVPISLKYPNGEQSDKLWINCFISDTPLDPYDALRVREVDQMSWEQPKYLDITTVLKREHTSKGYKLHSDDISKRELLKARLNPNVNGS